MLHGEESWGVRAMVLSLTGQLHREGWETPIAFIGSGDFSTECAQLGYTTRIVSDTPAPFVWGSWSQKLLRYGSVLREHRGTTKALLRVTEDERPDAIHFIWPQHLAIAGSVARTLSLPALWEMACTIGSGYPLDVNRRVVQHQVRRFNVTALAPSGYVADTLGMDDNTQIMPHGVDPARFDPSAVPDSITRDDLGISESAVTLGIFARLDPSKGQDRVLEALSRVSLNDREVVVCLFGSGSMCFEQSLRRLAATLPPKINVRFFGAVDAPERYYGIIDVAINSRIDPEPGGVSVLEAMAMARPILVHALGSPAEAVLDSITGWHVRDPSVEGFRRALARVLADQPRWRRMGLAARGRFEQNFTLNHQSATYRQAVQAHRTATLQLGAVATPR